MVGARGGAVAGIGQCGRLGASGGYQGPQSRKWVMMRYATSRATA
jgi:hypothetical protein